MSNTKKRKRGLFVGIIANIFPIMLSALANENITNSLLRRIVLFCHSICFELVCTLIILLSILIIIPFLKRMAKSDPYYINVSLFSAIIIFILPTPLINIKRIIYDRMTFYNNEYYIAQAQYSPFKEGCMNFSKGYYEQARQCFVSVNDVNRNGYYSAASEEKIRQIDNLCAYRDNIFNEIMNGNKSGIITLTEFRGIEYLNNSFPNYFDYYYDRESSSIVNAIREYPKLYEAVAINDLESSQQLIKDFGWCWFESIVSEKFLSGNRKYLLRILHDYIDSEPLSIAIARLCNKWNVSVE